MRNSVNDKPAVDKFITTSGRAFKDEHMRSARIAHRLWTSTTNKWGPNATVAIRNQHPHVTRLNLFDLSEAPVDWSMQEKGLHWEIASTPRISLRKYQKEGNQ